MPSEEGHSNMLETPDQSFDTRAVHAGRDPSYASTPIHMAATASGYYTRGGNPTIDALEASVAELEGGAGAVATACGMAAVTQTVLALVKSGDRIVCHRSVYDWTDTFFLEEAPKLGIEVVQIDMRDTNELETALQKPTQLLYFEPLSNPGLDVLDVQHIATLGRQAGVTVVADNTFLSPALLRPLKLGVDIVIHSATKFLCGHSDALGGVITSCNEDILTNLRRTRNIYGGVISPLNAFLILRGIGTLSIRMAQSGTNAQKVAEFLADHPAIAEVRYAGLRDDPGHQTAKEWTNGFGALIGFVLTGGQAASDVFRNSVNLCRPWVSLGDVGTLLYCRWPELRKGIPEGYVRMSVGLEHANDIIADLNQALNRACTVV